MKNTKLNNLRKVDWFPWGEEAFNKAKQENKPIFLSVGYSTCQYVLCNQLRFATKMLYYNSWCHVMEHESFENESVAAIMNKKFVNIKGND